MNNLNFDDGKWYEISLTFSMPHHSFLIGWNIVEPTKPYPYFTVSIHLVFIGVVIEWGNENWEIDE